MDAEIIKAELTFRTSRSGGKGGQHVNKVETKVEAIFDVEASVGLNKKEKALILEKLQNRISSEGTLGVTDQSSRSQMKNKVFAIDKLIALLAEAVIVPKKRKKRRVSLAAKAKRADAKQRNSEKKALRVKPKF